jgi:hypothetical protein
MTMEDQQFPVAHLRPDLDDQFSFRSDEPLMDNVDLEPTMWSDVQTVVASEEWFQVSCQGLASQQVVSKLYS